MFDHQSECHCSKTTTTTTRSRNSFDYQSECHCSKTVQLDQVRESVIKDGTTLTAVNGNKVKNPDVTTMHSLINEKNALLPKIIKFIADTDTAPVDELAAFNAS